MQTLTQSWCSVVKMIKYKKTQGLQGVEADRGQNQESRLLQANTSKEHRKKIQAKQFPKTQRNTGKTLENAIDRKHTRYDDDKLA